MKDQIEAFFKGKGQENYSIQVSSYPREAIIIIRDYAAEVGSEVRLRVYAVGGDGIAFDCLNGVVGLPNAELALMPYGSSNDFVRSFGPDRIPLFRNLEAQTTAQVIPTDIVKCSNQQTTIYSLCDCLFGVEAAAAYNIVNLTKKSATLPAFIRRFSKNLLYTLGGLQAVFNQKIIGEKYKIIADGEDISGAYATINISNVPCYGGDKNPVITADPTDGWLDMLTTKGISPLRLLTLFTGYLSGKYCRNTNIFSLRRVHRVIIKPESPQLMVNMDGEAFFDLQVAVEVLRQGVNIVAPGGASYRTWELPK
jgi:diacylglycerol kinase family enzyme